MGFEGSTDVRQDDGTSAEVSRIRTFYAKFDRERHDVADLAKVGDADQYLAKECLRRVAWLLEKKLGKDLSQCRVLDLGCGYGSLLSWFHEQGVPVEQLVGIDLLPHRTALARKRYPELTFLTGNAEEVNLPPKSFDLVLLFTVFSSILEESMARNVARSISDLITPGGTVIWYDMRYPNPWNPSIRGMTIPRIRKLFPSFELDLESTTLIPQLSRRLGPLINLAYPLLASVPLLRSHYLGLLRAPGAVVRR